MIISNLAESIKSEAEKVVLKIDNSIRSPREHNSELDSLHKLNLFPLFPQRPPSHTHVKHLSALEEKYNLLSVRSCPIQHFYQHSQLFNPHNLNKVSKVGNIEDICGRLALGFPLITVRVKNAVTLMVLDLHPNTFSFQKFT